MDCFLQIDKPLVSVNWLCQHLDATNLVVLNGTLPKVTANKSVQIQEVNQIKKARFFDLKKVFSLQGAPFPNTVLAAKEFQTQVRNLGINKDSCIVVYDEHGIYSSPRVWWLFKTVGFDNVTVLDGGFPAWKKAAFATEKKEKKTYDIGDFEYKQQRNLLVDATVVLNCLEDASKQIVDARSSGRFHSIDPEPRADIRSGRIPNSRSLPYSTLVSNGQLKSEEELKELFQKVNSENKEMVFSCGSGITACVLALGATVLGYKDLTVYDGSWTEWGSLMHLPIEE